MPWIVARTFKPHDRTKRYLEHPDLLPAISGRRSWIYAKKFACRFEDKSDAERMARFVCGHIEEVDE